MQSVLAVNRFKLIWISVPVLLFVQSLAFSQETKKVVYVTKAGEKYHSRNCRYLKSSCIEIEIDKATKRGYTPCSVCRPGGGAVKTDSGDEGNTSQQAAPATPQPKRETVKARQCSAQTKAGTRCKRTTTDSSGRCWQHQ
jgi:hypothetical protein